MIEAIEKLALGHFWRHWTLVSSGDAALTPGFETDQWFLLLLPV
jgi:hypothetical protein